MQVKKASIVVNGGGDPQATDHWAFLEEIDAPSWVDLAAESVSVDQDINASWFEVAHPFHQLSSQHFLDKCNVISDADLLGPSSLGLPPSVSRSRGKHYRSKKWRGNNNVLDKQHPIKSLAGKTSLTASSSYQVRPRIKISSGNKNYTSSLKGKPFTAGSATDATRPYSFHRKSKLQYSKITANLKKTSVGEGTSVDSGKQKTEDKRQFFHTNSKHTSSLTACFSGNSNSTSSSCREPIKHKVSFVVDSKTSHIISPDPPKSDSTFGNSESTSVLAASSVGSSNSSRLDSSDFPKSQPSFRASESPLKSQSYCRIESNPQDVQARSDLSHQGVGQTNGLLLAVKASLRRSYVTSQPARVEVKDKRQSNGRKSSSGKLSVGSSTNSDCNRKNTAQTVMMNKNRTAKQVTHIDQTIHHDKPEAKVVAKPSGTLSVGSSTNSDCNRKNTTQTVMMNKNRTAKQVTHIDQTIHHDKPEAKIVTKPWARQFHDRSLNSKRESKTIVGKSVSQETLNAKVSHQTENRKALRLQNIQNSFIDGPKAKQYTTNTIKGNAMGCNVLNQNTARKENNVGSMKWTQKVLKHIGMDGEVVGPKVKPNARNDLKNPKNVVQRVYFR